MTIRKANILETKKLKQEILIRLIKAFFSENFSENTRLIPYDMRPKGTEIFFRCCIHKERAVLRSRTIAGLGYSIEEDDEKTDLSTYATRAIERKSTEPFPLTVLDSACKGCPSSRMYITDLCQGCVAKPCINACRFGAIYSRSGRSHIDYDKCKKCGLCISKCPYGSIITTVVPCEHVCPVDAIVKNEKGHATINLNKCILCGKCVEACLFGAIHAKSQLIDVLTKIKKGKEVVALLAPAIFGQFPCSPEQLHTAIKKIGFKHVYEVAKGADKTARTEAKDIEERLSKGDDFVTTSCCAAYNELVCKHLPQIKPFVSDTKTPLYYTSESVKKEHPESITVFFSPCFAKRKEALSNPNIDYVISFEELGALLIALEIEVDQMEETAFENESSSEGRGFGISGGVSKAVLAAWKGEANTVKPVIINGLTKQSIRNLRKYASDGKCDLGNLIEVMSCEGGCVGGNATLNTPSAAVKKISEYENKSQLLSDMKDDE